MFERGVSKENFHIQWLDEKGLSVIAASDLNSGDEVIYEPSPFVFSFNPPYTTTCCHNCCKSLTNGGNRCTQCKYTHYCSKECQQNHWKTQHKLECKIFARFLEIEEITIGPLVISTLRFYLKLHALIDAGAIETDIPCPHSYDTERKAPSKEVIDKFNARNLPREHTLVADDALLLIDHYDELFGLPKRHIEQDVPLMLHALGKSANDPSTCYSGGCLADELGRFSCKIMLNCFGHHVADAHGSALFCRTSLFNHGCDPNCRHMRQRTHNPQNPKVDEAGGVYARFPLKKGEELLLNYGVKPSAPLWERRARLVRSHYFLCSCERCSAEVEGFRRAKELDDAAKDFRRVMEDLANKHEEEVKGVCSDPDVPPIDELEKLVQFTRMRLYILQQSFISNPPTACFSSAVLCPFCGGTSLPILALPPGLHPSHYRNGMIAVDPPIDWFCCCSCFKHVLGTDMTKDLFLHPLSYPMLSIPQSSKPSSSTPQSSTSSQLTNSSSSNNPSTSQNPLTFENILLSRHPMGGLLLDPEKESIRKVLMDELPSFAASPMGKIVDYNTDFEKNLTPMQAFFLHLQTHKKAAMMIKKNRKYCLPFLPGKFKDMFVVPITPAYPKEKRLDLEVLDKKSQLIPSLIFLNNTVNLLENCSIWNISPASSPQTTSTNSPSSSSSSHSSFSFPACHPCNLTLLTVRKALFLEAHKLYPLNYPVMREMGLDLLKRYEAYYEGTKEDEKVTAHMRLHCGTICTQLEKWQEGSEHLQLAIQRYKNIGGHFGDINNCTSFLQRCMLGIRMEKMKGKK